MRPRAALRAALIAARRWPAVTWLLRSAVLATGAGALLLVTVGGPLGPGLVALAGALGLVAAAARPDGPGAAVVLGAASLAWTVRYGTRPPQAASTLLLAALLALHHQTAALAAALPPTAAVEPAVLLRFGRHGSLVLALSGVVAALALGVARPVGSIPLELAGLAAVVLLVAVPVLLALAGPGRDRHHG